MISKTKGYQKRKDIKLSTEYNAAISVRQHKSLKKIKKDFRQFLINSFSVCDSRNRAYEIARAMVDLHSRTKQRYIPRAYPAKATNSHVQTVTRATNFIETLGIFSVVRGYKKVNKYIFNHLDVLQEFFGLSAWAELMCARLFTSKLNINNNIVSKCQENDRFSLNFKPEKGSEGTDICFSSKTGLYIPLELRPLNGTIEISRADHGSINVSKLFYISDRKIERKKQAEAYNEEFKRKLTAQSAALVNAKPKLVPTPSQSFWKRVSKKVEHNF